MILSNIEIKDIHNGLYRDIIDRNSKLLVLHTESGDRINILLGVGRHDNFTAFESMVTRVPSRHLYQAHIVITYDFLLRNFSIVKHRFGADGTRFNSVNEINEVLSLQFIELGFDRFDTQHIISKISRCYNMTTGERIFFSRSQPYGGTLYDLHVSGENTTDATRYFGKGIDLMTPTKLILKHNFLS
mgnify:CR=1 FL=1